MLRRFLIAWRFVRDLRYNEPIDEFPWSLDDQDNLKRFMLSPTGVKFRGRLANFAITKALEWVAITEEPRYHAGTAYGIQLVNLYIENHLPEVIEEAETITTGEDIEEFLNRNG
jgi:hypothetical protein